MTLGLGEAVHQTKRGWGCRRCQGFGMESVDPSRFSMSFTFSSTLQPQLWWLGYELNVQLLVSRVYEGSIHR